MGALGQGVLSGVAEGFSDELKQRRKRKEEGADALRNKQADQLEQAMKNTQARGALQPGAPGYLKPEEVKQHIEDAQKQLTALYEPEEAPLLFQRLKGIFTTEPKQHGLELKPGMTLADVLAGSGPVPQPQDPGKIITPKPFKGQDGKWYVVRDDGQTLTDLKRVHDVDDVGDHAHDPAADAHLGEHEVARDVERGGGVACEFNEERVHCSNPNALPRSASSR